MLARGRNYGIQFNTLSLFLGEISDCKLAFFFQAVINADSIKKFNIFVSNYKRINDIKKEQFGITSQKASKKSVIDIMQEHCAREIIIIKNYQFETFFNV